jgi:putative ABC transport system substrate-binding protein
MTGSGGAASAVRHDCAAAGQNSLVDRIHAGRPPAKQATHEIPIVMALAGNPVETGLVESLARPGGNVAGMSGVSG